MHIGEPQGGNLNTSATFQKSRPPPISVYFPDTFNKQLKNQKFINRLMHVLTGKRGGGNLTTPAIQRATSKTTISLENP